MKFTVKVNVWLWVQNKNGSKYLDPNIFIHAIYFKSCRVIYSKTKTKKRVKISTACPSLASQLTRHYSRHTFEDFYRSKNSMTENRIVTGKFKMMCKN